MSAPQIGAQFGQINNNGTGGGDASPSSNFGESSSSFPGAGYPNEYYSHHSNEPSPTSPSYNSGSVDMQNSTSNLTSTTCDCNQIGTNVEETQTNAPAQNTIDNSTDNASSSSTP